MSDSQKRLAAITEVLGKLSSTLPDLPGSKTTWNGYIAMFIAAVPVVQQYPELGIQPKIMAWLGLTAGFARLYVGIKQSDADRTLAKLNSGRGPEVEVPAHPTPNDPSAIAVFPKPK